MSSQAMISMTDGTKIRKDLTGKEFGRLTVIEYAGRARNGSARWKCQCKCGNVTVLTGDSITGQRVLSCGCAHAIAGERKRKDLTGMKFGKLTVLSYENKNARGRPKWKCRCDCGNITTATTNALTTSNVRSCGCLYRETCERNRKDLTDHKFGRLTVIEYGGKDRAGKSQWRCRCECGKITVVGVTCLTRGTTQSCGCLGRELRIAARKEQIMRNAVFGVPLSQHYLYGIFYGIVDRCNRENSECFHLYGGRGITYDKSWKKNSRKFIEDIVYNLGDRPSPKHSLDRIDNNGNYEIGNLQWADFGQQANNKRCISKDVDQRAYALLAKICKEGKVDPVQLLKAALRTTPAGSKTWSAGSSGLSDT